MRHFRNTRKEGLAPGTPVYIGEPRESSALLTLTVFDRTTCETHRITAKELAALHRNPSKTYWFDLLGIHDPVQVQEVCHAFDIHPLTQEDIVNCNQRAKADEFVNYTFAVLKHVNLDSETNAVTIRHLSMVCGDHFLITFRESSDKDPYAFIRERLRDPASRLRIKGIDYLMFALIDTVVDSYYHVVEYADDLLDEVTRRQREYFFAIPEETGTKKREGYIPADHGELLRLRSVFALKSELHAIRRALFPVRDVINHLFLSPRMTPDTKLYIRDVQDHMAYIAESIDMLRDMADGIVDMALSLITFRTNGIMKILAIVSTIFIPLTFLAGIYGMNFEFMPELKFKYAYFIILGFMALISVGSLWFLHKKRWF